MSSTSAPAGSGGCARTLVQKMTTAKKHPRRLLLGLVLAGIHSALFVLIAVLVASSSDGEAGMAYYIFFWLDYPIAQIYTIGLSGSPMGSIFILGGLLWFAYGWILQSLILVRTKHGTRWLGGAVAFLIGIILLPELALTSLSNWEEQWERGTAAVEAGDLQKGIGHISRALELSPQDNQILDGMWDYLGRLHVDTKDYDAAKTAFHAALTVVESRSSRPVDHLNAHNQLSWFYGRIEEGENEEKHLRKAIEYNRLVYEGDSTQEADCWHRLAEIEMDDGRTEEALRLIDMAINMEDGLEHTHDWSLNYMKEQRSEWAGTNTERD